jgi:phage-related protein
LTVHTYKTTSGRDLIYEYIDSLSIDEIVDGYSVIEKLIQNRTDELHIKHWQGKISEVYFYKHNRLFYVTIENSDIHILHACRKQKNRTEKKDAEIVLKRAKEIFSQ